MCPKAFQTVSIQPSLGVLQPVAAVLMSVKPIFVLFFLRNYASDGNNLHVRHHCLILLHLLSLQKLAENSETEWQKTAQKTATRDC